MDIQIKCGNGSMVVHLDEFLKCHNITKVKKLLKLIRDSFTPECEKQIKEFVQSELEQYGPKQKELLRYIDGYKQKITYSDRCIYTASTYRSRYKKGSEPYKHHNEKLKQFREENKMLKAKLRTCESEYNSNIRDRGFYIKVLETLK